MKLSLYMIALLFPSFMALSQVIAPQWPDNTNRVSIKWNTNEIARIFSEENIQIIIDDAPNNRIEIKTEQSTYTLHNATDRLYEIKKMIDASNRKKGRKVPILHLD